MTPFSAVPEPHLDRALPGWATDAIRDGIPAQQASDRRKVWTMCMRIAMSAQLRGWNESEYLTEVAINKKGLWRQLTTRRNGQPYPDSRGYKEMRSAWETARLNINRVGGVRTHEEIAADAVELAFTWVDRLTDGIDGLCEAEAGVMRYVVAETERRGMLRVTCPGREVAEFAKVPHRTASRVLKRLTERGLLTQHSPGRRGTAGKGKAAIYGLTDPEALGT